MKLHVEECGAGTPVVILHGFTGSGAAMRAVAEGLSDTHRAICVDLVGHGRSPAPSEVSPYSMESCTEHLLGVLDDLGIERAHWIGYSMGGRAALAFAAAHPERALSVLVLGARAGIEDDAVRRERRCTDEALAERIEREGVAAFVESWLGNPLFASLRRRLSDEDFSASREQRLANRARGLAGSLRGMGAGAQQPLRARLADLDLPIAFAAGAEDEKFLAIARDLAASIPRARHIAIPEAGHAAHLENPGRFLTEARRFLEEHRRTTCTTGRRSATTRTSASRRAATASPRSPSAAPRFETPSARRPSSS